MSLKSPTSVANAHEEIPGLIETLLATEQRLEELTEGEADTVEGRAGRTFLLRRGQEQLRSSEAARQTAILDELRVLIDLMPAMIWFKDTNNGILRVNQRVAETVGKSIEEIEGKPSVEIYPREAARFYVDDLEVIRSGAPKLGFVETLTDRAGNERWVQTDKVPYRDKDGNVTGIVVMAQDITARKRTEEELSWKTALLEAQLHSTIDGILVVDQEGKRSLQNQRFVDLFKIPPSIAEEKAGENRLRWLTDMSKNPEQFVKKVLHLYAHPEEISRDEIELKDGTVLDRYSSPVVGKDGKYFGRIWTFHDITERKRTEVAMRTLHEQMQQWVDHAPVVLYRLKVEGDKVIPVMASENVNRMLGFAVQETMSYDWWIGQLHPEDHDRAIASISETLGTGTSHTEYRLRHKDGTYCWIEDNRRLIRDADGKPSELVGVWLDITERKQAQEELQASQKRLRDLIDGLGPSMFVGLMTPQGIMIECNRSALEAAGLKPEDVLGQPFEETHWWTYSPEVQQRLRETVARAAGGEASRYDVQIRVAENHLVDVDFSLQPMRDESGKVVFLVPSASVISERKQAENDLRESNEKFHQLADNITDVFWIRSPDLSEVQYLSPAFEKVWGRSMKSLLADPHHWSDFILPEDRERVLAAFTALTADAPSLDIEYRIVRPDGEVRWVYVRGFQVRDAADKLIRHIGIVTDITERRQDEESLRLLGSAVEQSKESILITDAELDLPGPKIIFVNPAFTQMTGYTAEEAIGKTPRILQGPRTDKSVLRRLRRNLEQGEVFEGVAIQYRKDGTEFDLEWQIAPLRDVGGKITHFVAIQRDITERKQLEAERETLHRELVDVSRRAGMAEIATNVLHNVGNVLNSVNISTGLIMMSVKKFRASSLARIVALLQEHAHDLGTFITTDARGKHLPAHLAQLSEHLIADQAATVGELDSLRHNVEHIKEIVAMQQRYATFGGVKEVINVIDLVEESLRMNEASFRNHGVEVIREFGEVPPLNVEKHKILQILINVLRNAKYACDDSGRPDKKMTVRVCNGDGGVKISVIDNGVGIPAENLERIFNHGFTTRQGGHGFGLHSGALAAEEMGGSLNVQSTGLGQGATFTLELPVEPTS